MTRVNFGINVKKLLDSHLRAEFIEIARIPNKIANGKTKGKVTPYFKLNKGHELYFLDKIQYIDKRYKQIVKEMIERKFIANPLFIETFNESIAWIKEHRSELYNDVNDEHGFPILKERLIERYHTMSQGKMKFHRQSVTINEAIQILE